MRVLVCALLTLCSIVPFMIFLLCLCNGIGRSVIQIEKKKTCTLECSVKYKYKYAPSII